MATEYQKQIAWENAKKIHPKAKGGTDSPRNLQAMQTTTNRAKGKRYPY